MTEQRAEDEENISSVSLDVPGRLEAVEDQQRWLIGRSEEVTNVAESVIGGVIEAETNGGVQSKFAPHQTPVGQA